MQNLLRIAVILILLLPAAQIRAQVVNVESTSATDHGTRIHTGKRLKTQARATERHGRSLKKKKDAGKTVGKDGKVYKRHGHFASREIRMRSKSKTVRRETLGVGTE